MEENIKNSFNRIETIMNNEVCEFNKTIIEGNLNVIKRYIENLIKEKKELKEKMNFIHVNNLNDIYEETLEKTFTKFIKSNMEKDYIPKSKVKEKIEDLKKEEKQELKGLKGQDRYFIKQIYQVKRIVLEKLLEEGE